MRPILKSLYLLLILVSINLTGCSSGNLITPGEYAERDKGFGAQVIVETNDGNEYDGELLAVEDSVLLICPVYGVSETEFEKGYPFYRVETGRTTLLALKGKKLYLTGMLIGGGIGAALGAAIGASIGNGSKDDSFIFREPTKGQYIAGGACCLGVTGIVVGGLIGLADSPEDKIIYDSVEPAQIDYAWLKQFARYYRQVPYYIRSRS